MEYIIACLLVRYYVNSLSEPELVVVLIEPLGEVVVGTSLGVSEDCRSSEHLGGVLNLGVDLQLIEGLVLGVVEVRVHEGVGLHLPLVEHLVGSAEVALLEIVLVCTVAEEEVARGAVLDVNCRVGYE
jgi:hypothetical protein